jgi:beta-lactamase class A
MPRLLSSLCKSGPVLFFFLLLLATVANAEYFDIAYIWDANINNVLDYKDRLENVFSPEVSGKLIVVGLGNQYGIVYDQKKSSLSSPQILARHKEVLAKAGLRPPIVVKEKEYYRLYNISYGVGSSLNDLKDQYQDVSRILGKEVGKGLCIQKIDSNTYALLYLRRGEVRATYQLAQKQAKALKKEGIKTAVMPENNDPIVFGLASRPHAAEVKTAAKQSRQQEKTASSAEVAEQVAAISREIAQSASKEQAAPKEQATQKEQPAPKEQPAAKEQAVPKEQIVQKEQPAPKEQVIQSEQTAAKEPMIQRDEAVLREAPVAKEILAEAEASAATRANPDFGRSIESFIQGQREKRKLTSDESTGWMVYDLSRNEILVDINSDQVFQAASMIKPYIALAYFHQVQNGKLQYTQESRRKMEAMIQHSNNSAANWLMRKVGGPEECEAILRGSYGFIFKNTQIKEYIPAGGRTYCNTSIPSDYIRFLQALWLKKLPYESEMRRLMALPKRGRLYDGTPIPEGTQVYSKTGTTAHLCGDMGILVAQTRAGQPYPYAMVGIIETQARPSDYGNWMLTRGNIIRQVSTLVYQELKKQHNLR